MTEQRSPHPGRNRVPLWLARALARATAAILRRTGRGATTLPGRVLLALRPRGIADLRRRWNGPVVLVSATNGKTTLTAMLAHICTTAGMDITHNMAGANLRSGIASTLLARRSKRRRTLLLEVDEATLPLVAVALHPDVVLLGNMFRDQLDRYGELDAIAERWTSLAQDLDPARTALVTNADDPLVTLVARAFADRSPAASIVPFGVADASVAAPGLPHAVDTRFCRICSSRLVYDRSFVGHLGHYHCPACDFTRPAPVVEADAIELRGLSASRFVVRSHEREAQVTLRIPGLYNVYNALGAAAAATALGIGMDSVTAGLDSFSPAFGRFERVSLPDGGSLTLLLVKNPTGLNEVVRTLLDAQVELGALMFALNDQIADGRDTSWIWDADLEPLLEQAPGIVASGSRSAEFALRCVYGGMAHDAVLAVGNLEDALYELLARAREITAHGHAYALVTYTAMLELRELLAQRGWVSPYWQEARRALEAGAT